MNTPRILTATIAALLLAPSLHAADRFWLDTSGTASFASVTNWSATSGGASGASVPGAADTANFDLAGTYTVAFSGGAITNTAFEIRGGTVTFDLNNGSYTLTAGIDIGVTSGGTGRLTLFDGTLDVDTNGDDLTIGAVDADGFFTVSTGGIVGAGGTNPDIRIGDGGDGTLTINNGGIVNSASGTFGLASGLSTGTATVTGLGSQWNNAGAFTVGSSGSGTLTVSAGATISGANSIIAGSGPSIGTATVSGAGSRWAESATLSVGNVGVGSLTISSGGEVTVATDAFLGGAAGSFGTGIVTGTNSRWTIGGALIVANFGQGSLTISSGGEVASATLKIGDSNGATTEGNVTITGAGSTLQVSGAADIGDDDSGTLTVSSGGSFITLAGADLGNNPQGVGEVTITGANSQWVNTGTINVAALGTGTLNVSNGGAVTTGTLNLNDPGGVGIGTLNFDGGTITTGSFSRVLTAPLNWTDGTLHIANGTFNNAGANLIINGADAADLPTLRLSGNSGGAGFGATTLTVGNTRAGALEITGLATLSVTNVVTGTQDTGSGTITVSGGGAQFVAVGTLGVGGTSSSVGGTGVLNISNGGTVSTNALFLWNRGTVNLDGGTLNTFTFDANGGVFNFNSGTVHFTGGQSGGLDSRYDALLGHEHRLTAGKTIRYDLNFGFTDMDFVVDGGTLDVTTTLAVGSGSILDVRSGNISASTLTNNAAGQIVLSGGSVALGTTFTNPGDLRLAATSDFSLITGTTLTNTGLIHGNGRVGMALTNNTGGTVRAAAGERMVFTGASTNNGAARIEVNAGGDLQFTNTLANSANIDVIGGTLRVDGATTNATSTGRITGRNAIMRFNGGLTNNGSLAFSFGTSDVFGDIVNSAATGRIVVSGNSNVTFYDDLVNNGAVQVSTGSSAVYFGAVSGPGSFPGGGTNFFEGDLAPGASPALITFGGNVVYGTFNTLFMEIGGTTRGTQYDAIDVAGKLTFDGTLDVTLINAFVPTLGNAFNLFDWGTTAGTFTSVVVPALNAGLAWNQSTLYTDGTLRIGLDTAFVSRTWDGGGANNDWSTNNNWTLDVQPLNNATANLIFAGLVRLAPSVDTAWNVASITFNNTAGAFAITGPQAITIGTGGIVNNDTQTQTIDAAIVLSANQTFTAAAGDLDIDSIALAGRTLALAGATDITLATATGTGVISKNNAGRLDITGALGTGGVTLNANTGTTNIGASETLAALNIANGATVTLAASAPAPALAPVPEPGVGALLAGAFAFLGARRRGCAAPSR